MNDEIKISDIPGNISYQDRIRKRARRVAGMFAPEGPIDSPQPAEPVYTNAILTQIAFLGSFTLPADNNRVYLMIQNQGAGILYADFNAGPVINADGYRIAFGGFYEPFVAPLSAVSFSGDGLVIFGTRKQPSPTS